MIFKTFNSDSDKFLSKLGILGKSFEQIGTSIRQRKIEIDNLMGAMSKKDAKAEVGGFWRNIFGNESIKEKPIDLSKFIELDEIKASNLLKSLQEIEIASKTNTSVWQEYFSTLSDGQKWQIEFVKNNDLQKTSTEDLVKANQQARASALAHNEAIKAQTLSAKAGKVALQALAMAGNMIAMWAVSKVVSGLYELSQVSENVAESAKELGDSFKDTSSDIEGYKSKIEELYKVINDEGASIEDVTNARKSLISVQDELIDKFGTEKGVINDVTDAINGQTGALDRLTNAKWQEVKNEFNDGGFWNDISNSLGGYSDNIDRMIDEYEDYHARIRLNDFINKDSLLQVDAFKSLLENNFDAEITFDASEGSEIAMLSGNANEIYEKLLDIQNLADQFHFSDSFENSLTKLANSARETSDKYKGFYNQYILYEKILTEDSDYVNTFKDITDAYEEYKNAFISNDESKIKQATENYAKVLTDATSTAIANSDSDVAAYFENMYPELQSTVEGWKFNVAFDANTDDLQGKVQSVLNELKDESGRSLTTEEILGLNAENEQYQALISIAHSYNMTLEEMIELLKERNLVSAMDYQGLVGLFGQENVNKLSAEDLEIAYTIKNVGNMTFEQLQSEIQKTKETADEMGISSLSITQTIDKLNTQLKPAFDSLKSAYQDIFTTDDDGKPRFTLENVDLSMLDSIKSAIDDLNENEELGISIDYSSFETLVDVLTNSESTADDVRNAMNGLAGTIVQSLNPSLQSTTAETYQLTKSMLESLGVANAEEVMISALGYSLTELSALRKAASDAGFDLANATDNEISMFIWEQTESGNCAQELYALQLKKVLLNSTTINTSADIEYILGLANSAGIASNALVKLAEAKQMLDTANANGDVRGIYEAKKYANQLRDEIQNDVINFKVPEINFGGTDKSKSSKSGSKSKSEKDLWLEEYKRKLEELKRQLNQGRLMPSPVVIQDV